MIYSVVISNLLLIWELSLSINQVSLILRLPTLHTIASILMEKLLSLFFCICSSGYGMRMYVSWVFFNSDMEGSDFTSYIKVLAF